MKSRTEKDFGSTRYGYGAARTYIKARARRRADTAILRAANEGLWTAREFRLFCESKLGRWFGDLFLYEASGLHGRQAIHVAREFLDREAWETYKVEAGISPKEASK